LGANIGMAQNRHDPSYSVHNYKHPNKAAEAAKNNYDHLQSFDYHEVKGTAHRHYKAQNNRRVVTEGGVIPAVPVEKNTNSMFSRRNYKRQF
jgi:hypothetical protein